MPWNECPSLLLLILPYPKLWVPRSRVLCEGGRDAADTITAGIGTAPSHNPQRSGHALLFLMSGPSPDHPSLG